MNDCKCQAGLLSSSLLTSLLYVHVFICRGWPALLLSPHLSSSLLTSSSSSVCVCVCVVVCVCVFLGVCVCASVMLCGVWWCVCGAVCGCGVVFLLCVCG